MEEKIKETSPDQKWANKSWKPFLIMTIVGAVVLTVGIVLYVLGVAAIAEYTDPQRIPDAALQIFLGYLGGAIACWVVASGLMCPGIPLMIVTIIKSNKAKAKLGLKK